ncbi:MAG: SCO family protein [Micavibrio aeruginosavorus]|uniref:SCO family protein n=1 Tax=Micavibrio aeruginosavorus TaxID=349221 RepID=A0A2W5PXQ0_9BACT|nr:MAG: SCO family protein [Micavibrio aeruginosavorus]
MTQTRMIILLLAALAGLVLAGAIAYFQLSADVKSEPGDLIAVTSDAFGGPFSLVDQNNQPVSEKSWPDQYKLIYFGFTYCPAICPTELGKITAAMNTLGDVGKKIQPIFVTVDPERDTPAKMKDYVTLFHPSLVGLSGTPEQVKEMLKAYKIYAAKRQDPSMSDYTMDHSSFIYFIAPDGRLLQIFKMDDDAAAMSKTISQWMAQESAQK